MQIQVSTRHGHLSESTQTKIISKAERLARLFERLTAIAFTVDLEHKDHPAVELLVSAEHKHDFVARDQQEDLMNCVEGVIQKVEQQIRKYKEKVQNHHKGPGLRQQGETPVE